ncbi:hypothetical protein GA0070624_4170 [Micromonospora rhizosphaerae]|uniref:Anti-sigma-D factor RsdA to sigma factor binding region n=1 Tax=Micromonospora rhizosphaerae TaxID=568872 RepID=A0A1C6SNC5_9ACTN|nr:hypothetical protein [Micromonospora rhizosphaerae]SCL30927.1 hypothetical protein GA0070624_4170 [Micromonospora rhizosphaerae]
MSERTPGRGDEAMDLDTLARDDMLLDALGRGEDAPADDDLAVMLAAWHADISDGTPEPADLRHPAPTGDGSQPTPVPVRSATRRRRPRPWALRLAAAVVAVVALASGLGIGSRNAGPSSPLWSLTKLLYPEQAEVRGVEQTIARARAALTAGRLDEAEQLLDQARRDLRGITDPASADRLRAELDTLSRELAAARARSAPTAVPPALPAPGPEPSPSTRKGGGTTAPAPQPSQPKPSGSSTGGSGPLLPLPSLPLPPPPSPSPLLPLPGLPLPTSGLLG